MEINKQEFVFLNEALDLGQLINQVVACYPTIFKKKVKVNFQNGDGDFFLYSNRSVLTQIIHNLYSFSLQYSRVEGEIYFAITDSNDRIEIEVINKVQGFKDFEISHYFDFGEMISSLMNEKEFTKKQLGILIIKELCGQLGGSIKFKSAHDFGTTFILNLPRG